jgi:hypothetical protein
MGKQGYSQRARHQRITTDYPFYIQLVLQLARCNINVLNLLLGIAALRQCALGGLQRMRPPLLNRRCHTVQHEHHLPIREVMGIPERFR